MGLGIFLGVTAALFNSLGYLFSATFLRNTNSPLKLLFFTQSWMLLMSLPFTLWLFPFGGFTNSGEYFLTLAAWVVVFAIGQGSFFASLRNFEASKLSSWLGLKIIVLTVIFMVFRHTLPNWGQILAVLISAAAAMLINWSGAGKLSVRGILFLALTLIFYSLADITENHMVHCLVDSGFSVARSAVITTVAAYTTLGIFSLPGLFLLKATKPQLAASLPTAAFWLVSQVMLIFCFALVMPVFGNVLLACRGAFSVGLGALFALLGWRNLDADITKRQWIRRAVAAGLMIVAIALYSWSEQIGK